MLTSIIILTHNKLEYTKLCIESIRNYTEQNSYELIVVDNSSTDHTVEWLKDQKDIKLIINEENVGFPKGCNQGIEVALGDNILLLNNDVIVTENWLYNLVTSLYSSPNIGAVGPVTNSAAYYSTIPVEYENIEELHAFARMNNISDPSKWDERLKLIGFCMLIKREALNTVGLLDIQFTPGNFEDDDYSVRLRKAGYKLLLCRDTFIHHYGSLSWRDASFNYATLLSENERKFFAKWGTTSESYVVHHDLVKHLEFNSNDPVNILHIGCKCGGTLQEIKNNFKNANLYGIESNASEADEAKIVANVMTELASEIMEFEAGYFDVILITDWNLIPVDSLLKHIKKFLNKNSILLGKFVNLSSYMNLYKLIQGENPYKSGERYFTTDEIYELFENEYDLTYELVNQEAVFDENTISFINLLESVSSQKQNSFKNHHFIIKAMMADLELKQLLSNIYNNENAKISNEQLLSYSDDVIIDAIRKMDQSITVFNTVAITHYSSQKFDRVLPYLEAAFQLDQKHQDTIYNIAFILHSFGEKDTALRYLDMLEIKDNEIMELYEQITGKLPFNEMELIKLLRRIEFDINLVQSVDDFLELFDKTTLTAEDIVKYIESHIIDKVKVLNVIATICFQNQAYEDIFVYLNKAFEYDKENNETLFNLGYILAQFGEHQMALNYLLKIKNPDDEIKGLIQDLQEITAERSN